MQLKLAENTKRITWSKQLFSILLGSFIMAIFANITITLPFTPVPIVSQNFIAILLGIILGPKRGAISVIAFLAQGMMGLPVFANMAAGPMILLGPTGGYLIGYVVSAFVAGYVYQNAKQMALIAAMSLGLVCQYGLGLVQLSFFVGVSHVLSLGFFPFILGDLLKMAISHQLLKMVNKA